MASKIENLEKNMQKLTIEVSPERFKEAMQRAFNKNKSRFSVPGFRKGKAPYAIVSHYYGEGVLYDDAIDELLDPAYKEALKEHDVDPFSSPRVSIEEVGSEKGLTFSCEYALKPEVKLGEYKGLKAYREKVEVSDEQIDQKIESARLRASRLVPVNDRPVQKDDLVTLDYSGKVDGKKFEGGSAENYELKIGSQTFIPGFEDQLIGHKVDESFDIHVTFPEEYHAKDLAGQEAVFSVTLHEIKERELPEVNDEFIKDISEDCDTVAEYREHLRKEEEEHRNEHADQDFEQRAVMAAVKNAEIDVPAAAIEDEAGRMLDEQRRQLAYQGLKLEDYLRYMNMNEQIFKAQLLKPAEERLRHELVLQAVAAAEKISVSDEELENRFKEMAELYKEDVDKIKESFGDEGIKALKEQMLLEATSKFIREQSVATDEKPKEENEEAEAETGAEASESKEAAEKGEAKAEEEK